MNLTYFIVRAGIYARPISFGSENSNRWFYYPFALEAAQLGSFGFDVDMYLHHQVR